MKISLEFNLCLLHSFPKSSFERDGIEFFFFFYFCHSEKRVWFAIFIYQCFKVYLWEFVFN